MLNSDKARIKEVRLVLPAMHEIQRQIFLDNTTRWTTASIGTKGGKSFGAAIMIAKRAWECPGIYWWIAPTLRQCKVGWDELIKFLPAPRLKIHKTDAILEVVDLNGKQHSRIEMKSGENPSFLRGARVDLALIDECARVSEDAFHSVITTLTQTQGRGYFISTPRGRTLFHSLFQKGIVGSPTYDSDYASFSAPTSTNPYVPKESIEMARKLLPADVFRQEYLAEFIDSVSEVFTGIERCIDGVGFADPEPHHFYIVGIDLAKHTDFTVLTVVDRSTRKVVYWERFNALPWPEQKYKIVNTARRYNKAKVIMDTTKGSYGDSIFDDLKDTGQFPMEGYEISTAKAKAELIKGLILAISEGIISFPFIPELIHELKIFEYKITPSGTLTYAAPRGHHSDCVISLALAVWGLKQSNFIYYHKSIRGI